MSVEGTDPGAGVNPTDGTPPPEEGGKPPPSDSNKPVTNVKSMKDLEEQAPELYKAMMEGAAMNIIKEEQRHQEELKKKMREMSQPQR